MLESLPLEDAAREADCSLILTDHSGVDYSVLVRAAPLIVDTRNALKGIDDARIVRL